MLPTRDELLDQVRQVLAKAGFAVSERCEVRPISFDVMARRDRLLLIVKILGNVDAFSDRVAHEMLTLGRFLGGVPLLVGERSGAGALEDGVAYRHRDIPVLTVATLGACLLDDSPPLAYATPGGLNVRIDGERLRRLRDERALSLGLLAQVAGVSRRAIQMYEEGMKATIEAALRLEEYLETSLITPIDPFRLGPAGDAPAADAPALDAAALSAFEEGIFRLLRTMGFQVVPTQQSPFKAVTHQDPKTILTGLDEQADAATRRRAQLLSSVASVAEKQGMIVVRGELRVTQIQGTPVLRERELERVRDPAELADLLRERKPRPKPDP